LLSYLEYEKLFVPTLFLFPTDNVGAECLVGTKGHRAKFPCRQCMIPKTKIHDSKISNYPKRTLGDEDLVTLGVSFRASCKELLREELDPEEVDALEFCKELSINPLEISIFKLGSYLTNPAR